MARTYCSESPPRRRAATLAAAVAAGACGLGAAAEHVSIDAPNVNLDGAGVVIAPQGFVARMGERVVMGDAMRFDQGNDDLYATGRVVYVMPGVRIHAARLGLHPEAHSGDAWEVEALIDTQDRHFRVVADRVSFLNGELEFTGVSGGAAHGGIIGIGASSLHVSVREHQNPDREGATSYIDDVTMYGPCFRVMGIPVLWLPILYRDFSYSYPWTRFRYGGSSRLGNYLQSWIGTGLPQFLGWKTHIEGRFDTYTTAGQGWGAGADWLHPVFGKGLVEWFSMRPENVVGGVDNVTRVGLEDHQVIDVEHRVQIPGGAISARWVSLPDADPLTPGAGSAGLPPDERFRADYLRQSLEERPFARRGVTAAWGNSLATLVVDTERRANDNLQTSDRLWGAQLMIPQFDLVGPLHASASAWAEDLDRPSTDSAALRVHDEASLSALEWLGGFGFDQSVGVRGLNYYDGRSLGIDTPDAEHRHVGVASAGVRLRLFGDFGALTHTFIPRIGVELISPGHGDALTPYDFGDHRDQLVEDRRYLVAGFDTDLTGGANLFRASLVSRWALRDIDREEVDPTTLATVKGTNALVEVVGNLAGSPIASLTLNADASYDGILRQWRALDGSVAWVVHPRVTLIHTATLLPFDGTRTDVWQQRPEVKLLGNRYHLDAAFTFSPDGAALDGWQVQATRLMVEGELTLSYQLQRDPTGHIYEKRASIGFAIK